MGLSVPQFWQEVGCGVTNPSLVIHGRSRTYLIFHHGCGRGNPWFLAHFSFAALFPGKSRPLCICKKAYTPPCVSASQQAGSRAASREVAASNYQAEISSGLWGQRHNDTKQGAQGRGSAAKEGRPSLRISSLPGIKARRGGNGNWWKLELLFHFSISRNNMHLSHCGKCLCQYPHSEISGA